MTAGEQIRTARKLVGWTQKDLAVKAGLHTRTIMRAEQYRAWSSLALRTRRSLEETFGNAGIEFENGDEPGVRLRKVP